MTYLPYGYVGNDLMDFPEQGPNRYAAFVETGKEDDVKIRLEYRFQEKLKFYVPKRELKERKGSVWQKAIKTLFPGYILIKGHLDLKDYYKFKNVPNLCRLLLSGKEILPIPYIVMDYILIPEVNSKFHSANGILLSFLRFCQ